MGFMSGEYGGQVQQFGALSLNPLADASHLVRREVIHDHHIAGPQSGTQHLLHIGAKNLAVVAAATVMTAAMPPRLIAPKVVSTCQWPWGVASAIRSPFGARPHALVICVVTPLSSRKINFSGAMVPSFSTNAARRCWFASVSRSRAWSDFFSDATPSSCALSTARVRLPRDGPPGSAFPATPPR